MSCHIQFFVQINYSIHNKIVIPIIYEIIIPNGANAILHFFDFVVFSVASVKCDFVGFFDRSLKFFLRVAVCIKFLVIDFMGLNY